jgi:NADH-quinone oxidoreductase subunit J
MSPDVLLFWFLALISVLGALGVLFFSSPLYAAFSLIGTMLGVSGLFATLGADFLAGVQLIVYAGAVLVLFVMVMMLFDLKHENRPFSVSQSSLLVKTAVVGLGLGLLLAAGFLEGAFHSPSMLSLGDASGMGVKKMGELIFTKYMFLFQILGVLLLVVAVGAVALARSKGGTHERSH